MKSSELSRSASFLRAVAFTDIVRPQPLGTAVASRARQHQLRLDDAEIRTVRRTNGQPARSAGDGGLARFCFLRALFHSRSLVVAFHAAVFLRTIRSLEIWQGELSLVRRHGRDWNDFVEGDLHAARRLRRDRGWRVLHFKLFQPTRRSTSSGTNLELCRSCSGRRNRCRADRVLLFRRVFPLEWNQRALSGV